LFSVSAVRIPVPICQPVFSLFIVRNEPSRKYWWLIPMVVVLLFFAFIIVLGGAAGVGPFIYTLF